jgi:hypothetical protein
MGIDRAARDRLSLGLRRLASGRLTNAEFDEVMVYDSSDEALVAISHAGWSLYDDFFVYRLRGRRALTRKALEQVARCVLFLDTDLPYDWPPSRPTLSRLVLTLVTFGHTLRRARQQWEASGPSRVWPFFRETDYQVALRAPRRLRDQSVDAA